MTSVIHSARTSTASVFDVVTTAASTITQLITVAGRAVDALDSKARVMHASVSFDTKGRLALVEDISIINVATEHADAMEEAFRRNFPGQDFDRALCYNQSLERIKTAVAAK